MRFICHQPEDALDEDKESEEEDEEEEEKEERVIEESKAEGETPVRCGGIPRSIFHA